MNIYVGNISFKTTEDELRDAFEAFGEVESARIITDNRTGRSKGFGFVVMPSDEDAEKAISSLDGNEVGGRRLRVSVAKPKRDAF